MRVFSRTRVSNSLPHQCRYGTEASVMLHLPVLTMTQRTAQAIPAINKLWLGSQGACMVKALRQWAMSIRYPIS